MQYQVIKHYKNSDVPEIAFEGDFESCIQFCEKAYKDSVTSFPEELVWSDGKTTCEIFENLDDANLN